MAWAQPVGVQKVEVRIDEGRLGDWQETQLSNPINDQSWVQWRFDWNAEPGSHYIAVRAPTSRATCRSSSRRRSRPTVRAGGSAPW